MTLSPNLFFECLNRLLCLWVGVLCGEGTHAHHHAFGSLAHRPGIDLPFHIFLRPLLALGLVSTCGMQSWLAGESPTPTCPHSKLGLRRSEHPAAPPTALFDGSVRALGWHDSRGYCFRPAPLEPGSEREGNRACVCVIVSAL